MLPVTPPFCNADNPAATTQDMAVDPGFPLDDPPAGTFMEEWAQTYMMGQKTGYQYSSFSRQDNLVTTRLRSYTRLKRGALAVEMSMDYTTVETLEGAPLRFTQVTRLAGQPVTVSGVFDADKLTITTSQLGREHTNTHPIGPDVRLTWGGYREMIERGFSPGTRYSSHEYLPEMRVDGAVTAHNEIIGPGIAACGGSAREAIEIRSTLQSPAGTMATTSWIDERGRLVMLEAGLGGIRVVNCAATEEEALADFLPADIFAWDQVSLERGIPPDCQAVVYKVTFKQPRDTIPQWPQTRYQTILSASAEALLVRVENARFDNLMDAPAEQLDDGQRQRYLASNPYMNTSDPLLQQMAHEALAGLASGAASDNANNAGKGLSKKFRSDTADTSKPSTHANPAPSTAASAASPPAATPASAPTASEVLRQIEMADRLRQYVSSHIRRKDLSVGFATASESARSGAGDCSEHAVLLAALGRLSGIPARVASGFAYLPQFDGKQHIMGMHMWTQFHIGGHWIDVDAALLETETSPRRIAINTASLDAESMSELMFGLMDIYGQIDIAVSNVE